MPIVELSVLFLEAGGGTPKYKLYALGKCGSEGFGFQALKSGIGHRNQAVLV